MKLNLTVDESNDIVKLLDSAENIDYIMNSILDCKNTGKYKLWYGHPVDNADIVICHLCNAEICNNKVDNLSKMINLTIEHAKFHLEEKRLLVFI